MEEKPKEHDLRLSMITQPAAESSRSSQPPPRPPWPPPPGPGWPRPAQTEVIEERGLTGYRVVAKLIDAVIVMVIQYVIFIPLNIVWAFTFFPFSNPSNQEDIQRRMEAGEIPWEIFGPMLALMGIVLLLFLVVGTAYYFFFEHITQQTLGKKAFDLKVIDQVNGRASWKQILVRSILTSLSLMFYIWIIELIVMLVRPDGRRITDLITGTNVIRVKPVYFYPPPQQRL
jgi:uncharacterized RDD family membrane protein YckC